MGDADYERDYLERKKKLKELHSKLSSPKAKHIQEIYHKIMGSTDSENVGESGSEEVV